MNPSPLWTPPPALSTHANLHAYTRWLAESKGLIFDNYHDLWRWSAQQGAAFWESIWQYFNILHDGTYTAVTNGEPMPFTQWFEGTALNYAEHIFRKENNLHPAIVSQSEGGTLTTMSWHDLRQQVAAFQNFLVEQGVRKGDRVVAFMPCIAEATIAFLATNALGAIWSSCSPDFGTTAVIDRFAQIEPAIFIAVDSYTYQGKTYDKTTVIQDIASALPTLKAVVHLGSATLQLPLTLHVVRWHDATRPTKHVLYFERVPFAHPMWVLYSSGTTGLPKAIVHSHGGILLEQLKYVTFHNDFKPGERCFWYTTTGWMMWNYIHGSLLAGGTLVLYDGSPAYPNLTALWEFAEQAGINHFGTSAGYILANRKEGLSPGKQFNLSALRSLSSTGSTLPPEGFEWVYAEVKEDLWLASMSGGTDVCSAFVGGNPTWPVYAGEIQCRALGCNLQTYNESGAPVVNEVGEMVIASPMPSMPVYFWNDPGHKRYLESYFDTFAGVWRHGDWAAITPREGVIIYGRSDATLNRGGVRIGTSEVYRAVDKITEVKDSLILCIERSGGNFWMPLFVVMQENQPLTDAVKKNIINTLRSDYSPRHVPDEIIAVPDIPYTISGKKTETPVKKVLMGKDLRQVINAGALKNPSSMDFFVALAKERAQ